MGVKIHVKIENFMRILCRYAILDVITRTQRRRGMRILIVEDERALCDTLAKSLKQKGYEVDACYDGDSALDWLLAEKYDLILLDLNLPGRDGMELLKALRERDRETRVLILSARSRISDKVEGLDCGANDYLVKPFHLEELEARVRSLTRRSFVQHDAVLR